MAGIANSPSYLGRLLDVLQVVGEEGELTVTEISQRAHIPLSTSSRLVGLLFDRHFLTRVTDTNRWVPGPMLERIGWRSTSRLHAPDRFDGAVQRLAELTGESVSVGLLVHDSIVLAHRRESAHPLRMVVRIGETIPPHTTALGKAILAFSSKRQQQTLLQARVSDWASVLEVLTSEMETVRERGCAIDDEVFAPGLRCVAAPFFKAGGEPGGAISVAGPVARFTTDAALKCIAALFAEVSAISRDLGFGDGKLRTSIPLVAPKPVHGDEPAGPTLERVHYSATRRATRERNRASGPDRRG